MAFEIGDIVVPVVNVITTSGEELNTAGVSGTVIDRNLRFTSVEEVSYYDYQVNMSDTFLINSGTQSISIFWFTEEDLGADGPFSNIEPINVQEESNKFSQGYSEVGTGVSYIEGIKNQMSTKSTYYDIVQTYLQVIEEHKNRMDSYGNTFSDPITTNSTGKAAGKQGETLGFDSNVLQELAANALGYHDIFSKLEEELKIVNQQVEEQNTKALDDDAETFTVYYEGYVTGNGNENVFIPDGYNDDLVNETGTVQESIKQTQSLLTLSGLLGEVTFPTGDQ